MSKTIERGGVLPVIKPVGITSFDLCRAARRLFCTKKVGHTGTLDPLASGVMVLLIGEATKAAEFIGKEKKEYRATLLLCEKRDTGDITGTVIEKSDFIPDESEIKSACLSFLGKSKQIPPMYSALKVGGKRLYKLAREGKEVEREPRDIEIFSIDCEKLSEKEYTLAVSCSAGTYIRSLCEDIAGRAGTVGTMKTLCRTRAGGFSYDDCISLEEIEKMSEEERKSLLIPAERLFENLPRVSLSDFHSHLICSGCNVEQRKLGSDFSAGERFTLYDKNGFCGIGECAPGREEKEEDPGRLYIRRIKKI